MNYRHTYHAGNFADVQKHAILALIIDSLKRKDSAFAYVDTHAGTGCYDLSSVQAEKTGEWRDGIGRIIGRGDAPAEIAPLLEVVAKLNPQGGIRHYPGSPWIAAALSRPQDRLALCELHPDDAASLKRLFFPDPRVGVHHRDGYDALKGLLPPPERRGLVLIDPPFEQRGEFQTMVKGLRQAMKRWPTGFYALWYPIKDRPPIDRFHADLSMLGLPKTLVAELLCRPDTDSGRLNGCGMVLINPPWKLDESLARLLPWLVEILAGPGGFSRLDWLIPEDR